MVSHASWAIVSCGLFLKGFDSRCSQVLIFLDSFVQRWWSWKLTCQLFLWLRSLFVERVEKWRSPRARWKNCKNVLALANEIQSNFLLDLNVLKTEPVLTSYWCWQCRWLSAIFIKTWKTLKVSEALNRLLKVLIIAINAQSHSVDAPSPLVWGWRSLVSIWEKADRLPRPCS